jgi:Fe-S-cluster containining protein
MRLEIDIPKLEAMSRWSYEEKQQYRSMLETCGLTSGKIDTIARRHYRDVSAQIDCRECANCCKVFCPPVTSEDIGRLALAKRMSRDDLIEAYLTESGGSGTYTMKSSPCPFLDGNDCSVYGERPEACRSYPGLDKPGFISRIDNVFSDCSVCPIAYHVSDLVKREVLGIGNGDGGRDASG